jgi:hypothetical protein
MPVISTLEAEARIISSRPELHREILSTKKKKKIYIYIYLIIPNPKQRSIVAVYYPDSVKTLWN